jgi:nitrous oxide reductase
MPETKQTLARRTWLGATATAGAAAAAVTLLPSSPQPTAPTAAAKGAPPAEPGGYQLTEHVKQYYASARV